MHMLLTAPHHMQGDQTIHTTESSSANVRMGSTGSFELHIAMRKKKNATDLMEALHIVFSK